MAAIDNYIPVKDDTEYLNEIENDATGEYVVTTHSGSRYIVNLDTKTLTRHREDESDWHGDIKRGSASHGIINIVNCTVGQGMIVIIDQAIPGVQNEIGAQFTTTVTSIVAN